MIENLLERRMAGLIRNETTLRRQWALALVMGVGALVGLFLLVRVASGNGSVPEGAPLYLILGAFVVGCLAAALAGRRRVSIKEMARRIETSQPDLQAALLTAVEQKPGPDGQLSYLQEKVVTTVVDHALLHDWVKAVSKKRLAVAGWAQAVTSICFLVLTLLLLFFPDRQTASSLA